MLTLVMPRSWLWYQSAVARWSLPYWYTAVPGLHSPPKRARAAAANRAQNDPTVAYPAGMFLAFGSVHASG